MNPQTAIFRRPMRTVRPKDVTDIYAFPAPELARLTQAGMVHRLAYGYYMAVPPEHVGTGWIPALETAAAGIATAIAGPRDAVAMGLTAARMTGAVPRAQGVATIAIPRQHGPVELLDRTATVYFVKRDTARLDAERVSTEAGPTLATTAEQTVLDLAVPNVDADPDVIAAIRILYRRCRPDHLVELATAQRKRAALGRVRHIVEERAHL